MEKLPALAVIAGTACFLSGCVLAPIALVGGGIVGGMAISEDTVQTEFDRPYDDVWAACVKVLEKAGAIAAKDKEARWIETHVLKSRGKVKLEGVTLSAVRIQAKSRKVVGVLPDIKTSHMMA